MDKLLKIINENIVFSDKLISVLYDSFGYEIVVCAFTELERHAEKSKIDIIKIKKYLVIIRAYCQFSDSEIDLFKKIHLELFNDVIKKTSDLGKDTTTDFVLSTLLDITFHNPELIEGIPNTSQITFAESSNILIAVKYDKDEMSD